MVAMGGGNAGKKSPPVLAMRVKKVVLEDKDTGETQTMYVAECLLRDKEAIKELTQLLTPEGAQAIVLQDDE